jgi:hypothetical protein
MVWVAFLNDRCLQDTEVKTQDSDLDPILFEDPIGACNKMASGSKSGSKTGSIRALKSYKSMV